MQNDYDLAIGAKYDMKNSSITGLFSGNYHHSSSLALNLVFQSIIKDKLGPDFGTVVTIDPCYSHGGIEAFESTSSIMNMKYYLEEFVVLLWLNKLAAFHVKESSTGVKAMYLASGLGRWVYYTSNLLFDITSFFAIKSIDEIIPEIFFYFKDTIYRYFRYRIPSIMTYYVPAYFYCVSHLYFTVMFFRKAFNAQVALTLFYILTGEFLFYLQFDEVLRARDVPGKKLHIFEALIQNYVSVKCSSYY